MIIKQEVIPALGHNFTNWETITEATQESEGLMERYCERCEHKENKTIEKLTKKGCSGSFEQSLISLIVLSIVIKYLSDRKNKKHL